MPSTAPRPLRILAARARAIGDTVLVVPALRNLRAAFPGAHIDLLVAPHTGTILSRCPYVDHVYYWKRRGSARADQPDLLTGLFATAHWLRARHYDRVYNFRRAASSALLLKLAGIPHRVGFATELGGLFLHRAVRTPPERHEVECALDLLRADGIPVTDTRNEGWTDPEFDRFVESRLPASGRRRVFVCAKSSEASRDWRPERFAALIDWLVGQRGAEVHVCDNPANATLYNSIRAALPAATQAHVHDWSRDLNLLGTLSLLKRMDLAVGVDTGLLHLAACFHVPVVTLISARYAQNYHPWDTAYRLVSSARPEGTVGGIELAQVLPAVEALWPGAAPSR